MLSVTSFSFALSPDQRLKTCFHFTFWALVMTESSQLGLAEAPTYLYLVPDTLM